MHIITRAMRVAVAALFACGAFASTAGATTISVVPSAVSVNANDPFSVDIVLSGLTEAIGGAQFQLSYSSLVSGTTANNNPDSKMSTDPSDDFSSGYTAGPLYDYFVLADGSLSQTALGTLQGTGFTLARIGFLAGAFGGSVPLTLGNVVLSNYGGDELAFQIVNSAVRIDGPINQEPVPEPTSLLLLGTGIGTLVMRRRRQQQ